MVECSAASKAVNDAVHMVNRGGKVCLAAFTHEPALVDIAHIVQQQHLRLRYPRRGQERGASRRGLHAAEALRRHQDPHPYLPLADLPTAIRYAKDRVDDAIKVVVKAKLDAAHKVAAE